MSAPLNVRVFMCAKCGTLRGWNVEIEHYEPALCSVALHVDGQNITVTCDGPLLEVVIV